jgi:hypothetical protein
MNNLPREIRQNTQQLTSIRFLFASPFAAHSVMRNRNDTQLGGTRKKRRAAVKIIFTKQSHNCGSPLLSLSCPQNTCHAERSEASYTTVYQLIKD